MGNPDIQELNQRAGALRSLADHIEKMMDEPQKFSMGQMKTWEGPNATDVRGKLSTWKTTCGTVAKSLREEAQQSADAAKDLQKPKT
ncbi:hypothetical protein J7F03_30575 [Streptomyces sp. ISL-43]|uniref:hypothetical protein n=1 Tax=Streptomyces sp. ISL-43 TaxID=2819183 RepID=UPI001BE9D978|nr:hypothetical protein [Streptomyces sp. ISL-43]MBT2451340.1 hypothetical protein [Streptomyces sp. ISL-43]